MGWMTDIGEDLLDESGVGDRFGDGLTNNFGANDKFKKQLGDGLSGAAMSAATSLVEGDQREQAINDQLAGERYGLAARSAARGGQPMEGLNAMAKKKALTDEDEGEGWLAGLASILI